jgi:S1-C subfamily serine protease
MTFLKKYKLLIIGAIYTFGLFFVMLKAPEWHNRLIRKTVGQKVVQLYGPNMRGSGTGFFIETPSDKIHILTNRHVCEISKDGFLIVKYKGKFSNRKIIKMYEKHDLCLVDGIKDVGGLELGSAMTVGQIVGVIGHPYGGNLTLSKGEYVGDQIISMIQGYDLKKEECRGQVKKANFLMMMFGHRTYCLEKFFTNQVTLYTRPGSSGSPLIDFYGNVIGVLFAGNTNDNKQSYIVPLSDLEYFLSEY